MKNLCVFLVCLMFCGTAHAQQPKSDGIDTYLEYTPYAAVFALKACGVESRDDWTPLAVTTAASWVAAAGTGWVLKHCVKEWRPDHTDQKSFPSGHATIAFAGATALRKEFGHISPWISVAGYGAATFVAVDRVVKDRHHWYDVAAGAGIGIVATEVTWWLSDRVFKRHKDNVMLGFTGNTVQLTLKL